MAGILCFFLSTSFINHVFATQLTTFLPPKEDKAVPEYIGDRFITMRYDPSSELSKKFAGQSVRLSFKANMTTPGMSELVADINQELLAQKQSLVKIDNATIDYTATLRGSPDQLTIAYKVSFKPTITGYASQNNSSASVVDLDWRGFEIPQPLPLNVPNVGNISINYPIGLFAVKYPELVNQLESSPIGPIMKEPLLDFKSMGVPMDRWHFLFDPTGSQAGAAGAFIEKGGSRVVSVFSLGESSFREGTHTAEESDASGTIDGTNVRVHASTPPPSGQIQIPGFARIQSSGGSEFAIVSEKGPEGVATSTGGFPLQVLLILGGMMAGVAVLVLFKARK